MRHNKTYSPFCPDISIHPDIDYEEVVRTALRSYPGAQGDAFTALKYLATHRGMSLAKGIKYYSEYHHKENEINYRNQWVARYLNALDYLNGTY